jgi:pyruvate dehydrogenase E1 component alpha subunit
VLDLLRQMVLVRRFEEKCAELYALGKIRGFLHLYIGEEAVAAGCMAWLGPDDNVVATYREHGHALLRGTPAGQVMAEMFGKANGCCRGRGGSMHLFDRSRRFFGGHAIVGGALPVAVGLALADRLTNREAVTACFFGDGATEEGEFHESLNLAALWQLPVLFICENNRYAMGTAIERHAANVDRCAIPRAHGITAESVDGMDVLAVEAATRRAVDEVRRTNRPYFLEASTYRFRAHSMYDPDRYRPKQEVEWWVRERDPIALLRAKLRVENTLTDEQDRLIEASVATVIEQSVQEAERGSEEPVEALLSDVYTPRSP